MKRSAGITILELLIVLAIMSVIMGVLTAFFRQQTQLSSHIQARNEVQTKLRSVAEVIMQDLQMAGSRATFDGSKVIYLEPVLAEDVEPDDKDSAEHKEWRETQCNAQYRNGCVVVIESDAGNEPGAEEYAVTEFSIYYATSLRDDENCRRIDYLLGDDATLMRRDVACQDTDTEYEGFDFAGNIDEIELFFICHDPETIEGSVSACYGDDTYPRQGTVRISGRSDNPREDIEATITLATSLPNLRPPADYIGFE